MSIKASDQSSDDKRRLLDALHEQLGDQQYYELLRRHGEDVMIDMVMQASVDKPSLSKRNKHWGTAEWACFGFLWLTLTVCVGFFSNVTFAVLFFFSPSLYLLIFQAPGILGSELAERLPWGCGFAVAIGIMIIVVGALQSVSEAALETMVVLAFVGALAAWIVASLAKVIARMMRRFLGNR